MIELCMSGFGLYVSGFGFVFVWFFCLGLGFGLCVSGFGFVWCVCVFCDLIVGLEL